MEGNNTAEMSKKLKMLRGKKSQARAAKEIGISESALSMYEIGARIPRDEAKIKIAKYYGKTVQYIFFK